MIVSEPPAFHAIPVTRVLTLYFHRAVEPNATFVFQFGDRTMDVEETLRALERHRGGQARAWTFTEHTERQLEQEGWCKFK